MTEVVTCPVCGARFPHEYAGLGPTGGENVRDRDQTASDQDQTWSDHDQTASDRDQRSADEDQEASDQDFAVGGDAVTHRRTSLARKRSSSDRDAVSALRDETADARLESGEDRDRAAELRDRGAEGRDALARLHDLEDDSEATREDILLRAERDRARAAADRAKSASDRLRAASDRREAARQREEAVRARAEAAHNLELATTDELTGAWMRKFGLAEVTREIERAHRTSGRLVLAFIDVDGLKGVNDTQGHAAGDALLHLVGEALRANVRPYDVIVRYGGDEFLCAMPDLSGAAAKKRMSKITAALRAAKHGHSISFGLAELDPADGVHELVARADAELLDARRSREGQE